MDGYITLRIHSIAAVGFLIHIFSVESRRAKNARQVIRK